MYIMIIVFEKINATAQLSGFSLGVSSLWLKSGAAEKSG